MTKTFKIFSTLIIICFLIGSCANVLAQVEVTQKKDSLFILFNGTTIFKGLLSHQNRGAFKVLHQSRDLDGASMELVTITAGLSKPFELNGTIMANEAAIAVESDPRDNGLKVIRHSVGPSQSLLNNAVTIIKTTCF